MFWVTPSSVESTNISFPCFKLVLEPISHPQVMCTSTSLFRILDLFSELNHQPKRHPRQNLSTPRLWAPSASVDLRWNQLDGPPIPTYPVMVRNPKSPTKRPIYTWNPNDPCFDWKRPCFGGFNHKNRGQTGSRYIYSGYLWVIHPLIWPSFPNFNPWVVAFFSMENKAESQRNGFTNVDVQQGYPRCYPPWVDNIA